jgi:hypothetical protein
MSKLEDLQPNASLHGVLPNALVTVVNVTWHGSAALDLTYRDPSGKLGSELLYRHDEPRLQVAEQGRPWSFDGDGRLFRLVSEANRIRLASSPEAIYRSLRRRRERLERRLRELEILQRGAAFPAELGAGGPELDAEDVEDLEEAPDSEVEAVEEEILDQATAARTIVELKAEIETLSRLEALALAVRRGATSVNYDFAELLARAEEPRRDDDPGKNP